MSVESPEALSRAVNCLRAGQLVGVPGDSAYHIVASALDGAALDVLHSLAADERLAVTLAFPVEVFDWLPYLGGVGVRLARRHWPGPVTLVGGAGLQHGLARRLGSKALHALCPDRAIALALPNQRELRWIVHQLSLPVALANPGGTFGSLDELEVAARGELALTLDAGPFKAPQQATVVRVEGRHAHVAREGAIAAAEVEKALPCRILFVCTGNTCRSPMAKALCEKMLADQRGCSVAELPQHGFVVESAGIAAFAGDAASPESLEAIRPFGGDLQQHRSQPLSYDLLAHADFVFAMTRSHLRVLRDLQQDVGPLPRLLSVAGEDVFDPIGGPPQVYEDCARQIHACLEQLLPEILENG